MKTSSQPPTLHIGYNNNNYSNNKNNNNNSKNNHNKNRKDKIRNKIVVFCFIKMVVGLHLVQFYRTFAFIPALKLSDQ